MSTTALTHELELFQENVKRFAEQELVPHYDQWEREEIFPRSLWNTLGEQGLLAVDLPETYGGTGADFHFSMEIVEEFSRSNCSSIATSVVVHSDIVAHYIANYGSEAQKHRYLPGMISGECVGAIAMTEPAAGSDLQGIRTTARQEGAEYVLNGQKTFITNGQHCDLVIVAARTKSGVSGAKSTTLFLVDVDEPGFTRGRNLEKLGLHSSDTSELFFDDVRLQDSQVLGEVNGGFGILMSELVRERLALSACCVAAAEGMLTETAAYVNERQAFGSRLADLQNTRFRLAEAATLIRVNRSFINECKSRFNEGTLDVATVSMAKLSAAEMQSKVMDTFLQVHGGYGYMREFGVARAFVDSRVQRIYGGASEIMQELIARDLLD